MFCEEFVLLHGPPVYVYTVPCRAVLYLYANGSLCVCVFNLAVSLVPGLAIGNAIVNAARVGSMADPHSPQPFGFGVAEHQKRLFHQRFAWTTSRSLVCGGRSRPPFI